MIEFENLGKMNKPFFEEFKQSFTETLESGWYVLGRRVVEFEQQFSAFTGSKHCVGVASGLDALTLSLAAHEFAPGSEVLVPSNTYIATILSFLHAGLKPVLVEPDIHTYNIDPVALEEKIGKRTVAVMVVHLYGKPCTMDRIMPLAQKHDLVVIEDCAQSHGAEFKGKRTGSFGECGAFSFYPTKNLGALGDGGGITTSNPALLEKLRQLRNYGSSVKYYNECIGYNSRLDELQAAFLLVKLARLEEITCHKRILAHAYHEGLKADYIKPVVDEDCFDVFHIYTIRHPDRDRLREYLLQSGIRTEVHYPHPPHRQKAMVVILDAGEYPIAEEIHRTTLSLPISFFHSVQDINRVVETMNNF